MPDYKKNPNIQYESPDNLIEIKTIYLNDFLKKKIPEKYKKIRNISEEEKDILFDLVKMNPKGDFYKIYKILNNKKLFKNTIDFLMSDVFWDFSKVVYNESFSKDSFNEFFWTYRSMFISIINMFQLDELNADIYHSVSTGYAGFIGSILKYKSNKAYVLTEHGIYPREREEEILKSSWVPGKYKKIWINYFYFISKLSYQSVDQIVTLFEKNREIQHKIGAPRDKTMVIPNAVDLERLSFYPRDKKTKDFIVGAVLRVTPIKDVMTLIRAFKIVKIALPETKFEIIGPTDEDIEYFNQCKSLVKLLNLEDFIIFTGRANVIDYYKRMDVLVLTSVSEGQPLVILEAMAIGIPIVATDVGACREMVLPDKSEERCGFITNLVSPNETANRIVEILQDSNLSNQMRINGRKRVEKKYKKDDFISQYIKIYNELG